MRDAALQAIYLDNDLRISIQMYDKHRKQCTAETDSEANEKRMLRGAIGFSDAKENSAGNTWIVKKEQIDRYHQSRHLDRIICIRQHGALIGDGAPDGANRDKM